MQVRAALRILPVVRESACGPRPTGESLMAAAGQATAASSRIKGTTVDCQECLLHLHERMVRYQAYTQIAASSI